MSSPSNYSYSLRQMKHKFDQLGIEIIIEKNYILLKPPIEMDLWNILASIAILFSLPDFQEKDDIWLLSDGYIDVLYSDLEKIKCIAENNFPKYAKRGKTAIVVKNDQHYNLAVSYADIGKKLPRKIKVFRDFNSAGRWITE
ncbi:MAG: hypothetical protein P8X85_12960 [Desulfobacterales bacterium]